MSSLIDGSSVKSIVMPRLVPDQRAVDVWFEYGKIHFQDPADTENGELQSLTIAEFEEHVVGLNDLIEANMEKYPNEPSKRVVYCGILEWRKFYKAAREMTDKAKTQVHIGMPLGTIYDAEQSRRSLTVRPMFEQRRSGLVLPR